MAKYINTDDCLRLARKHLDEGEMVSSARACMQDAIGQYNEGNFESARMWCRKSLAYSVGIFHKDYQATS